MHLLAINTSSQYFSAAIVTGKTIKAYFKSYNSQFHHEASIPMLADKMKELNISHEDFENIALISEPGSLTGIRAGYSIASALHLLNPNIKLVLLSPMDLVFDYIAKSVNTYDYAIAMIEASARTCYIKVVDKAHKKTIDAQTVEYEQIPNYLDKVKAHCPGFASSQVVVSGSGAIPYFKDHFLHASPLSIDLEKLIVILCPPPDAKRMIKPVQLKLKYGKTSSWQELNNLM